ncbi:MAG TPA: hypothetical protein PKY87_06780 [Terricaulis sp.]|nr:hypothetical protein [Terricaulis sp.]
MDWGSVLAAALLISLAILVLRALWCWLIVLIGYGPPALIGLWIGHGTGAALDSFSAGLFAAVLVSGYLTECLHSALRRLH